MLLNRCASLCLTSFDVGAASAHVTDKAARTNVVDKTMTGKRDLIPQDDAFLLIRFHGRKRCKNARSGPL